MPSYTEILERHAEEEASRTQNRATDAPDPILDAEYDRFTPYEPLSEKPKKTRQWSLFRKKHTRIDEMAAAALGDFAPLDHKTEKRIAALRAQRQTEENRAHNATLKEAAREAARNQRHERLSQTGAAARARWASFIENPLGFKLLPSLFSSGSLFAEWRKAKTAFRRNNEDLRIEISVAQESWINKRTSAIKKAVADAEKLAQEYLDCNTGKDPRISISLRDVADRVRREQTTIKLLEVKVHFNEQKKAIIALRKQGESLALKQRNKALSQVRLGFAKRVVGTFVDAGTLLVAATPVIAVRAIATSASVAYIAARGVFAGASPNPVFLNQAPAPSA